jgi:ankyrin repeat protein
MRAVHIPKDSPSEDDDGDTEEIMPLETTLEEAFLKDHRQFEDLLVQLRGGGYDSWKAKLIKTISSTTRDPKGFNLLLVAVDFANDSLARDVVELIVQEDPNLIAQTNVFGNSTIHYAAARNRMGLIKYLAKFGARLDMVNARGQSPLHIAVRAQSEPVVEFLLRNSSRDNVNAQVDKGRTALHLACRDATHAAIVTALLGAGADASLKDDLGLTPMQLSEKTFNVDVMDVLHPNGIEGLRPPTSFLMGAEDYKNFTGLSLTLCYCEICQLVKAVDIVSMTDSNTLTKCACLLHLQAFQIDFLGDALLLQSTFDSCNCEACANARDLTGRVMQRPGCNCPSCLRAKAPNPYGDMPPYGPFGDPLGPLPRYPPPGPFGAPPNLDAFGNPLPFPGPYDMPPPLGFLSYGGPLGEPQPLHDIPLDEYPGHEHYDRLIDQELLSLAYEHYPGSRYNAAIDALSNAGFRGKNSYRMNPEKALTWVTANYATLQQVDEIVKILLDNRAQVHATDKSGCTCLHIAARNGDISLAKLLIERGADLNFPRKGVMAAKAFFTPIRYALYYRQDLMLRLLLRASANIDEQEVYGRTTLLHDTVDQYSILAIHLPLLLAHGANPNLLDEKGNTPLHIAATNGHLYAVQALLDSGADIHGVSKNGATALTLAIEAGHSAVVSTLISKGADVHARCSNGSPCALFLAVQKGQGAIVQLLLESTAVEDIRRTDRMRRTVLHILADSTIDGILDTMGPLIDFGADVNAEDYAGSTPLHEAARVGSTIFASELVMRGATVHAQDRQGKTPLDIATQKKHREVVELLGGKLKKKGFWRR